MKTIGILLLSGVVAQGVAMAQDIAPAETQIAAAVLAAPEARRAEAAVLGYDSDGKVVKLREGRNDLICLADNPTDDSFSVACYHEELVPYMARGRELTEQGVTGGARNEEYRWKEARAGTLPMPTSPRMLYVLTGSGFDAAKGEVTDAYARWVMYWPDATPEMTGLAVEAGRPGEPWLMDAGTPGAHVMISPPRN